MKKVYPGWEIAGGVLAFPHGWQRPAKTEEWAYERCLVDLPENRYAQMLCFPWATLIDLQRRRKAAKAQFFLEALQWTPPKTTLLRATVMQHIWSKDVFPMLERLGITDVFWAHATKGETRIGKLRIHPFPLYPVCCANGPDDKSWLAASERRYLYSFIGAYEVGLYLSPARQWIFDLPTRDDALVERRSEWHFDSAVYKEQIGGVPQGEAAMTAQREREHQYSEVLRQSVFSLCPSGSGPNTIRLWESIRMGAIPVVISDHCQLPGAPSSWEEAAIFAAETQQAVRNLPTMLAELASRQEVNVYQEALRTLAGSFSPERLPDIVRDLFTDSLKKLVKGQ